MEKNELHQYLMDIFHTAEYDKAFNKDLPGIGLIDMGNGNYIYHIGNGVYTGEAGWEQFNKAMQDEFKKDLGTKE